MNSTKPIPKKALFSNKLFWRFLLPSMLGLAFFMLPIQDGESFTIPIAILSNMVRDALNDTSVALVTLIVTLSAAASLLVKAIKPKFIIKNNYLNSLLNPSWPWLIVRVLGGVFIIMTFFKIGPQAVFNSNTGGMVLTGLLPTLFSVFIFAGLLLPLLLDFGLLELIGTLLIKVMRPLFKLPGRSAVDCITSWLGDGSVGILLTSKQYEQNFYTAREAAVVGTTFSAVSITFTLIVISEVGLEHLFFPFYVAICFAGIIAALIIPRLPPLRNKPDVYFDGSKKSDDDDLIPSDHTVFSWGITQALNRAATADSYKKVLQSGLKNSIDMIFGVLPVVMGLGTLALIIAEYTPLFNWLGMPFVPYLELLGVPEATQASKTMMVGFADMFIPAIIATSIDNEMTRFIIAAMSVTQLIYMSEVGALLLGSKIPVNLFELFIIFILRTLITLPVVTLVAKIIF